jgi:hypothetical protein
VTLCKGPVRVPGPRYPLNSPAKNEGGHPENWAETHSNPWYPLGSPAKLKLNEGVKHIIGSPRAAWFPCLVTRAILMVPPGQNMLVCGTECHMSSFVVTEQELDEKFRVEVIYYPTITHYPATVSRGLEQLGS